MTKNLKSILDDFNPDYPGVYRFIGYHPIKLNKISPFYVGKSGDSESVWDYIRGGRKGKIPQMLKGRILRHLNDDAGILGMIIDDIKFLKCLEYWIVDPIDFKNVENYLEAIRYLEYYIRIEIAEKTYYDEIVNVSIRPVIVNEEIVSIVKEIYKNKKQIIEFPELSDIEQKFLNYYNVITSVPIKKLISFRRYKTVNDFVESFIESWKDIKKENYFWHKIYEE